MKIVDLKLNIDGLILNDNETVEGFIDNLNVNSIYKIVYEILYCEEVNY